MLFVSFNVFSLYLICVNLINTCLSMLLLGFILYGTLYAAHFSNTGSLSLATFPLVLSAFPQFPPETKENQPEACDYLFVGRWGNVHTIRI